MEPELHRASQAAIIAGICLVTLIGLLIFSIYQTEQAVSSAAANARAGIVAHEILCGEKAYFKGQVADSEKFLALTQAQRVKLYGAVGNIPNTAIAASLVKQRLILTKFDPLHC